MPESPTIFVSHAGQDREFVERDLLGMLRAVGLEPWYSKQAIRATEAWEAKIEDALESATWFLVVMSEGAVNSKWVKREVAWAIEQRKRIVPRIRGRL